MPVYTLSMINRIESNRHEPSHRIGAGGTRVVENSRKKAYSWTISIVTGCRFIAGWRWKWSDRGPSSSSSHGHYYCGLGWAGLDWAGHGNSTRGWLNVSSFGRRRRRWCWGSSVLLCLWRRLGWSPWWPFWSSFFKHNSLYCFTRFLKINWTDVSEKDPKNLLVILSCGMWKTRS